MKRIAGLTLIEMMVSVFILSVGVLAAIGSFRYISTSIQFSKSRTLSANLAQEQIEKLKNLSYYTLLVTTSPLTDLNVPAVLYDPYNYPPQSIIEGGISFKRATRVDFAYQNGASISTSAYTTDDTSLKQITVYVMWRDGTAWKYLKVQSLMANPAAVPLSSGASGWVRTAASVNIPNALVQVIDNSNWYANTDNSGNYRFSVTPGSYTLQASSNGYYTSTTNGYQNYTSGNVTPVNFTLTAIASGTVSGNIYKTDHLVVSEVVVSTDTNVEYVELYNPTTAAINIGTAWPLRSIDFYIFDPSNNSKPISGSPPVPVPLVYVSTYVASNKYYLIADVPTIHVAGQTRNADAYYTAAYQGIQQFALHDAGGTGIATVSPVVPIDALAWDKTAVIQCPTTPIEGNCKDVSIMGHGLDTGEILIRQTDPSATINPSYGRAYDTDDNNTNFSYQTTIPAAPNSMSQGTVSPRTGTPATGAIVSMNDLFSNSTTCNPMAISGTYNVCAYSLVVATGSWTMDISSGNLYAQIQNITVQTGVSTGVPNGATNPTWASVGNSTITLLNNTTIYALVSGHVYGSGGAALPGIKVSDGNGRSVTSVSGGLYNLLSSTGDITLTANPNDGNMVHAYVTQARTPETFNAGMLYDNRDFTLELGGIIRGYFQTSSGTPLPGRVAIAQKTTGSDTAQAASDSTGYFYLQNLSTGTYTITPQLDTMETADHLSLPVVMSSTGTTLGVSTFTIISGIAQITGQVTIAATTKPVITGSLIMASSNTISSALPPTQNGATGTTCNPCYYAASSDATGNYTLQVRSSTTPYKVYGWYSTVSTSSSTILKSTAYSITVSTPGQIMTQNISW